MSAARRAAAGVAVLALAGCVDAGAATSREPAAWLRGCRLPDVEGPALCGSYAVPEDRASGRGRRLPLRVVVLPARRQAARQPDPIVVLHGGPGLGAASEPSLAQLVDAARDTRDVVLVDQRGTGESAPLACAMQGDGLGPFLGARFPVAAVRACRAALERHADLRRYTTPDAADDLDDVRAALGYERVNLLGLSYGSKAALVYLRRHAAHVRSAVLDGVVTPDYPTPLPAAAAGDAALRRVFADCAADPACRRASPDPAGDFRSALRRLQQAPARVALGTLPVAGERGTLTARAFLDGVWESLYDAAGARTLPAALHDAARGDFDGLARRIARARRARWPRYRAGALLSIVCTEDVPFIAPAALARAEGGSLLGAPMTRDLVAACAEWPRAPLPADERAPVRSDAPVLLLSGERDPVTPPEWAARAARALPNSRHVVRPGAGHVDDDACSLALVANFVARPDPAALDVSCVARVATGALP